MVKREHSKTDLPFWGQMLVGLNALILIWSIFVGFGWFEWPGRAMEVVLICMLYIIFKPIIYYIESDRPDEE